jgi:hypothetical protein
VAYFARQLYVAMRPAEVVGLREEDCYLPETGWGTLCPARSGPTQGGATTSGA